MSHYAKVVDGKVIEVIVAEADFINSGILPGTWIQTSYNTKGNVHHGSDNEPDGGVPLRANYAGIGYTYDSTNDVFYPPQPYTSWILDQTTWTWQPPISAPTDGRTYRWDEPTTSWVAIE
jgi:hypothetical protein